DVLNGQIGFFASNFLAPDEQYKVSFDFLNDELGKLGLSADMTKDQYAELIRSVTEVGGVSVETASKLLELAPAFLNVKNAADQLKASVNQNLLSFAGNLAPDEVLGIKYSMMSDALSQFGISADISREQLIEYVREFVNSGGLLTVAAESVMNTVGITLDYLNTVDQQKANVTQNTLSLAETFVPEEVVNIKFGMLSGVLSELGIAADTSKEELIKLLKEFVASGGLYGPLAEKVMRAAGLLADANNTLDQINMKRVNDAYAALQHSVDSERTRLTNEYNTALDGINTQIENVTDSISKLKSLSDALKSTVNAIRPMERSEAKAQIEAALNTARSGGGLPNIEDISQALGVLKQQSTSGFTSSFDFAFEQAKTASMLGELGVLSDDQLSTEERSLNALKESKKSLEDGFAAEMGRLDKILEDAQTQIGLLTGIETNTKTIADALASLRVAISNAGAGGSIGGFSGVSNADIRAFVAANPDPMVQYRAAIANDVSALEYSKATGTPVSEINKFTASNGLAPLARGFDQKDVNDYFKNYKSTDFTQVAKDAFQFGATSTEISKATGKSIAEIDAYTQSLGLGKLSKYSDGGYTGQGGKFQPTGIVHAGEYVFSQEAVNNLGLHTLEQLHESAKRGEPEGYTAGGLVGSGKQIMGSNVINAMNRFADLSTERHALSDASIIHDHGDLRNKQEFTKEFEKEQKSISKIEETANALNSLNDTNSISNIDNVINAKRIFENRAVSSEVRRDLLNQANITSIIDKNTLTSARSFDQFRGFASGGYTGNAGTDKPVGIVHGREYVFSAPAVDNIGLDTLEKLHKAGKDGKPSGFAEGGFIGEDIGPAPIAETSILIKTNNNQSGTQSQEDVVAELRLLREVLHEEIKQVREYTRRTSNKLDAVTQGGTALRTKTA
ncbi:hypothetical protein, partial [Nitrosomonas sp. Nm34]|uniref:hypothetical protein n=1 Tax=Nitrosomonas sp. Nm34 TaxID=1881055 RepID=UPI0008F33001